MLPAVSEEFDLACTFFLFFFFSLSLSIGKGSALAKIWGGGGSTGLGGVLRKRCSENMLQRYRRTPMPKCDFTKVALQLYRNHTLACVSPVIFAANFQNIFL